MRASLENLVNTLKDMQNLPKGEFSFSNIELNIQYNGISTIYFVRHNLTLLLDFIESHVFDHVPDNFDATINQFIQQLKDFSQQVLTPNSVNVQHTNVYGYQNQDNPIFLIDRNNTLAFKLICENIFSYLNNCTEAQTPLELQDKYKLLLQASSELETQSKQIKNTLSSLQGDPVLTPEELSKIKSTRDELNQWHIIRERVDETRKGIEKIREDYRQHCDDFKQHQGIIAKETANIASLSEKISKLEQRQHKLSEELDNNLKKHASLSLGASFDDRKTELDKEEQRWRSYLFWSIGGIVLFNIYILLFGQELSLRIINALNIKVDASYLSFSRVNILLTQLMAFPLYWVVWLASRQIMRISRLKEDYAFKAATASSYIAYEQTAMRIDSDLSHKLLDTLIDRFNEHPLKQAESKEPASPAHELTSVLKSRSFLKHGSLWIKDGASSLTELLNALDKVLKSAAAFKDPKSTASSDAASDSVSKNSAQSGARTQESDTQKAKYKSSQSHKNQKEEPEQPNPDSGTDLRDSAVSKPQADQSPKEES